MPHQLIPISLFSRRGQQRHWDFIRRLLTTLVVCYGSGYHSTCYAVVDLLHMITGKGELSSLPPPPSHPRDAAAARRSTLSDHSGTHGSSDSGRGGENKAGNRTYGDKRKGARVGRPDGEQDKENNAAASNQEDGCSLPRHYRELPHKNPVKVAAASPCRESLASPPAPTSRKSVPPSKEEPVVDPEMPRRALAVLVLQLFDLDRYAVKQQHLRDILFGDHLSESSSDG